MLLIITVRLRPLFGVTNLRSNPCFVDSAHQNTVNSSFETTAFSVVMSVSTPAFASTWKNYGSPSSECLTQNLSGSH